MPKTSGLPDSTGLHHPRLIRPSTPAGKPNDGMHLLIPSTSAAADEVTAKPSRRLSIASYMTIGRITAGRKPKEEMH